MNKKKIILLLLASLGIFAFSIFTNTEGYYRSYRVSDIPFIYKINVNTASNYITGIDSGANSWTKILASYFEFRNGGSTTAGSVAADGVNLVYFDAIYQNFTPNSNIIAFSSTMTSGSGSNYHATESDLIWNAGDFPPGMNGEPGLIDLESTIAHEFGHHLGLGHTGAAAGSEQPGAGDVIPEATMFYAVAQGDTSPRSLHIDDKMGAVSIYTRWKLAGTVQDSVTGEPIYHAYFDVNGTVDAIIGPPESIWGTQRGGWVVEDTIFVNSDNGAYYVIPYNPVFGITFHAFGYQSKDTTIEFTDSTAINFVYNYNPKLAPIERYSWNIQVADSVNGEAVPVFLEFYAFQNPAPGFTDTLRIDTTGTGNISLPPGTYSILIKPSLPYGLTQIDNFILNSDTSLAIELVKADLLIVDDDYFSGMGLEENVQDFYFNAVNGMVNPVKFAYRELSLQSLPDTSEITQFDKVIWFTGGKLAPQLTTDQLTLLQYYLDHGGKLFMSGQNLLLYNYFRPLFRDYFKVGFGSDNAAQTIVYNIPGDPISGQFSFFKISGEDGAFNQTSPDVLTLKDGAEPTLRYSPPAQNKYAAVRVEDGTKQFKLVFFAFGFESITDFITPANSGILRANMMEKIFDWLDSPFTSIKQSADPVLLKFNLAQNYPNPFNPKTVISYQLPVVSKVELSIYNVLGQKVATLVANRRLSAGTYKVDWDATGIASGIYYYQLKTDDFSAVRKMILLR